MFVCKWPLKISPFMTTKFTLHFFTCYFPSWKFALGSSSFPDCNARIVHALIYIDTSIALQSQLYTRPSLDLLISLKVHKSTRSEDPFFFPVLFSLLYVYEMLARPIQGLFAIENVLKLHAPLHCTAVHNFCQKRVFIICPIQMLSFTKLYDFLSISG